MQSDEALRKELLALLEGGNAHMTLDQALVDFPLEFINRRPPNTPYSFWHFLEHLRIAQWDILEFVRDPSHVSPEYPAGYRPNPEQRTDQVGWRQSQERFNTDLQALQAMVRDQSIDLLAPIPHARHYNIFREALLAADHNAYHIGEIAILRQVMGLWPEGNKYLTGMPD